MKRRHTTPEERALFRAVASGKSPLVRPVVAPMKAPEKPVRTNSGGGLDGGTARRLARGELLPSAKIDLHGMTEAAAHRTLLAFLHTAHRRGDRLVLVVTGKGAPANEDWIDPGRGVLKRMVPRWLKEPALARIIAHMASAHRRHGGEGALYVYLKKRRD